jgi:hypothetical protein
MVDFYDHRLYNKSNFGTKLLGICQNQFGGNFCLQLIPYFLTLMIIRGNAHGFELKFYCKPFNNAYLFSSTF